MRGIVDRIEEEHIIVELESEEIISIKREENPLVKEGDVIIIDGETIIIDKDETNKRQSQIEKKFRSLFE